MTNGCNPMKYLKRLKNELVDLTEKLGGAIFDAPPSKKANRARLLQSLVLVVKHVVRADKATDDWTEDNGREWFTYLAELEEWIAMAPVLGGDPLKVRAPVKVRGKDQNLRCEVGLNEDGYEVVLSRLTEKELLAVRNGMLTHSAYTQEAKGVLNGMIEALKSAGIDLGDASYPLRPWEAPKKSVKKPEAAA